MTNEDVFFWAFNWPHEFENAVKFDEDFFWEYLPIAEFPFVCKLLSNIILPAEKESKSNPQGFHSQYIMSSSEIARPLEVGT